METTVANYTLPAVCHVVCTLLATGITGINVTSPVPGADQPHNQTFPEGYIAHPDVGFAYKVHNEIVNATDARRGCMKEGAQLALIDSTKKLEYVMRQKQNSGYAYVGIIRMYDDTTWAATSTGLPVSSIPWANGELSGSGHCVLLAFSANGLSNYGCHNTQNYVCELPISEKNTLTAN